MTAHNRTAHIMTAHIMTAHIMTAHIMTAHIMVTGKVNLLVISMCQILRNFIPILQFSHTQNKYLTLTKHNTIQAKSGIIVSNRVTICYDMNVLSRTI